MDTQERRESGLSITYLLLVTAGVAISISVGQGIGELRHAADSYYGMKATPAITLFNTVVASIYGLCVTTFLFVCRSGSIWKSPGKVLALLFAIMGLVDGMLSLAAAAVMYYRMHIDPSAYSYNTLGYIIGIWYINLPPTVGYLIALPILAYVFYRSKPQRIHWRTVWIGFFISALLMTGNLCFGIGESAPEKAQKWGFIAVIGIPIVSIVVAMLIDIARRERFDWWTLATAPLIIGAWGTMIAITAVVD